MFLEEINDLIDKLELSETSLSNIRNLSALYVVKSHILGDNSFDSVKTELQDIFPAYESYIDLKRKYQLHEISESSVIAMFHNLCEEILEFLQSLYSGLSTQQEKEQLFLVLKSFLDKF